MKKQPQRHTEQVNKHVEHGSVTAGDEGLVEFVADGVEGGEDGGRTDTQTSAAGQQGKHGVGRYVRPFFHEQIPHAVGG